MILKKILSLALIASLIFTGIPVAPVFAADSVETDMTTLTPTTTTGEMEARMEKVSARQPQPSGMIDLSTMDEMAITEIVIEDPLPGPSPSPSGDSSSVSNTTTYQTVDATTGQTGTASYQSGGIDGTIKGGFNADGTTLSGGEEGSQTGTLTISDSTIFPGTETTNGTTEAGALNYTYTVAGYDDVTIEYYLSYPGSTVITTSDGYLVTIPGTETTELINWVEEIITVEQTSVVDVPASLSFGAIDDADFQKEAELFTLILSGGITPEYLQSLSEEDRTALLQTILVLTTTLAQGEIPNWYGPQLTAALQNGLDGFENMNFILKFVEKHWDKIKKEFPKDYFKSLGIPDLTKFDSFGALMTELRKKRDQMLVDFKAGKSGALQKLNEAEALLAKFSGELNKLFVTYDKGKARPGQDPDNSEKMCGNCVASSRFHLAIMSVLGMGDQYVFVDGMLEPKEEHQFGFLRLSGSPNIIIMDQTLVTAMLNNKPIQASMLTGNGTIKIPEKATAGYVQSATVIQDKRPAFNFEGAVGALFKVNGLISEGIKLGNAQNLKEAAEALAKAIAYLEAAEKLFPGITRTLAAEVDGGVVVTYQGEKMETIADAIKVLKAKIAELERLGKFKTPAVTIEIKIPVVVVPGAPGLAGLGINGLTSFGSTKYQFSEIVGGKQTPTMKPIPNSTSTTIGMSVSINAKGELVLTFSRKFSSNDLSVVVTDGVVPLSQYGFRETMVINGTTYFVGKIELDPSTDPKKPENGITFIVTLYELESYKAEYIRAGGKKDKMDMSKVTTMQYKVTIYPKGNKDFPMGKWEDVTTIKTSTTVPADTTLTVATTTDVTTVGLGTYSVTGTTINVPAFAEPNPSSSPETITYNTVEPVTGQTVMVTSTSQAIDPSLITYRSTAAEDTSSTPTPYPSGGYPGMNTVSAPVTMEEPPVLITAEPQLIFDENFDGVVLFEGTADELAALKPAVPVNLLLVDTPDDKKPKKWDNNVDEWTDKNFPAKGDEVEIIGKNGMSVDGTVTKSAAKTTGNTTIVQMEVDENNDGKADTRVQCKIIREEGKKTRIEIIIKEIE